MNDKQKSSANVGLVIGIMGFIAGVILTFSDNWQIGLFGGIASLGIAIKGYQDIKASKKVDER
ncbi:hypothetical protein [Roseivirga misakiensis]|uniref:Uncharacterized protein n=1 Tax=Roseivirga misakiensis TaxID=1563681 RepID=A0A1E5SLJ3_9BACT|nr:hypothetical protein [Roseivirga misakiensis]OEJ99998.1 hypothetical protein BFP71_10670 [Roseivirga misakiensis]